MTDLIESTAKALYDAAFETSLTWEQDTEAERDYWRTLARVAVTEVRSHQAVALAVTG